MKHYMPEEDIIQFRNSVFRAMLLKHPVLITANSLHIEIKFLAKRFNSQSAKVSASAPLTSGC